MIAPVEALATAAAAASTAAAASDVAHAGASLANAVDAIVVPIRPEGDGGHVFEIDLPGRLEDHCEGIRSRGSSDGNVLVDCPL